ncbi:MAG: DUF5686 family protein [Bacteroidales bacterium]|nr:DUF5686 family protein [Bacteroidales bacterium]
MKRVHITYTLTFINLVLAEISSPNISLGQQKTTAKERENIRTIEIDELVVRGGRVKYRNKGNPAVELIDSVVAYKERNRSTNFSSLKYQKYEKIVFSFTNVSERIQSMKLLNKFRFIFDNMDTTRSPGRAVLPMYIRERLSDFAYDGDSKIANEIVRGERMVTFEEHMDEQGLGEWLNYLYEEVDLYENNILFLTNKFISPISPSAPTFYRYYITDTTTSDNERCTRLFFTPRNKTDFLFQGYLYITMDGTYAVKRAEIEVNKNINLNWIKESRIVQEFKRTGEGGWILDKNETSIDLGYNKSGLGIFGQRSVSYRDYTFNQPIPRIYLAQHNPRADSVFSKGEEFWSNNRHQELSKSEKGIYETSDSLKKMPTFRRIMNLTRIILASYHDFGKFELGPMSTFYSYNPTEGSRVRVGGMTTTDFSKRVNLDGHISYGFRDKQFKYKLGTTISLTNRSIYEFPVRSLRFSIQKETKVPGVELYFVHEGSAYLSISRGIDDKLFYNKSIKAEYFHEFENHFSYKLGYNFTRQKPGGSLDFGESSKIDIGEVSLDLRYAPNEQFYQKRTFRTPIANKYPILQLNYTLGNKILGGDFNYHFIRFNASKRFYPSVIGYTDAVFESGLVLGNLPFPLLEMHNANQSYIYQATTYNLMNFLEFVSDKYASLFVDHNFNGFLLNKIPLIKHLGLREIVTFKVLYGGLNDHNNPNIRQSSPAAESWLMPLPKDKDGNPATFTLDKGPYIEVSVGIGNIFKLLRVDLVRRVTYLDNPNITKWGVRFRLKFDL